MKTFAVGTLALCMTTTAAFAEANLSVEGNKRTPGFYIGTDFFSGDTEFDAGRHGSVEVDQEGFRARIGGIIGKGFRIEGYFKKEETEETVVNLDHERYIGFDKDVSGIGANFIKTFALSDWFQPFVQAGIGYDWRDITSSPDVILSSDTQYGLDMKLGIGGIFNIADRVEILGGFDWQYRTWQEIEFVGLSEDNLSLEDTATNVYLGFNILF